MPQCPRFNPHTLIARTFFMIRRRCARSCADNVGFLELPFFFIMTQLSSAVKIANTNLHRGAVLQEYSFSLVALEEKNGRAGLDLQADIPNCVHNRL